MKHPSHSSIITKLSRRSIGMAAVLLMAAAALVVTASQAAAGPPLRQAQPLHPTFALLDSQGVNVLESGGPVSTMQTCGACHDTEFILQHSYHANLGLDDYGDAVARDHSWDTSSGYYGDWSAIDYRYLSPAGDERIDLTTPDWIMLYGARIVGGGPTQLARDGETALESVRASASNPESATLNADSGELDAWNWRQSGTVEMDCFLCHLAQPNNEARVAALAAGEFAWANTASLAGTGIVDQVNDEWIWSTDAFQENGELARDFVTVQDPSNSNCAQCHGVVHTDPNELLVADTCASDLSMSYTTGQIISGTRIANSGLNISGKDDLNRSWDIHAERLVNCVDCHYSLNNPVFSEAKAVDTLEHLIFDPRRLDFGAYLSQPLHQFARTEEAEQSVLGNPEALQACEGCHTAKPSHTWLPYTDRHMEALSCETCHVPQVYTPSAQQIDWTVLSTNSQPRQECRGTDVASTTPLITSYSPVLMQSKRLAGDSSLAPFNLVTAWYWVYGDPVRPVRLIDLEAAWLVNGEYPAEIIAAFDADGDGLLAESELAIQTAEQEALIAGRLEALGLDSPHIVGEVQSYSLNHTVAGGEWAIRDCQICHTEDSQLAQDYELASYLPGGVMPEFLGEADISASGSLIVNADGGLSYRPAPSEDGYYVLGHDNVTWVDWFGVLALVGTFAGVVVHGGLRVMSARRLPQAHGKTKRVYMYGVYERLWHWLQSFTILMLLFTGLVIHKPAMFGFFSFRGVVLLHNILAGILVVNAVLALFYHLASGEIKQYIPRPAGFFGQAIEQTLYYVRGIFSGEPHPFEKTIDRKLNPLQQITYFGLLNVLLPLQVLTGITMWGAQRWPQVADALGGLPFLGPFHSLIAWLLASFIVMHIYLTTTAGETALSGIKSMMMGWEDVETHDPELEE